MKIIPLINEFTNTFNETFNKNLNPLNLESKIKEVGDTFTLKLYEAFLNYLDNKFKNSKQRKLNYNIKETRKRTLITSIGFIVVNSTSYIDKNTKERFVLLREILNLKPYQRLTNEAEYQLIKYAMDENMAQAARHALRNTIISRSTVSKKLAKLDGSINQVITRCENQPDILYIEMDEIHANLQKGGNKICPCAIVHEGYNEVFVKRNNLKNIHYFASSKLTYEQLWEVIFDYVNKKYDIDKFKKIFISGDGAIGIKNQKDEDYKVACSMEDHINQAFARYITSSPYGFSEKGLENKLKLLIYHANRHELTIEDYYNLKYGTNSYEDINIKINKLTNIKYDQKLSSNHSLEYKIDTSLPIFDSHKDNNKLSELLSFRGIKYI